MFEPQKCCETEGQNMAFDLPYNVDLPPILIIAKNCTGIQQVSNNWNLKVVIVF